MQCTYLSK